MSENKVVTINQDTTAVQPFVPENPNHPGILPFVDVDILDRPRKFLFNLNALCYIERTTGRTVMTDAGAWANLSMRDLRHFIYAGLVTDDPSLTLGRAGELLVLENMAPLFQVMMTSWNLAMTGDPIPLEVPLAA